MEIILLLVAVLIVCIMNVFCLVLGVKIGQKGAKGEPVTLPAFHPVQAIKQHREEKEIDREQKMLDVVLENIDTYNGTSDGQRDVPGR